MEENPYGWHEASIAFVDYKGEAALDVNRDMLLEDRVGLDPDRWVVVGLDIGKKDTALHVIAVERDLLPEGADALRRCAAEHGGKLPVVDFQVHDIDAYELLHQMAHGFELKLLHKALDDCAIEVVSRDDVPSQVTA